MFLSRLSGLITIELREWKLENDGSSVFKRGDNCHMVENTLTTVKISTQEKLHQFQPFLPQNLLL